tara:strand:+ start:395 stop:1906 length:1512 start_codon:yes stop_codon:yes gene_type:complete
MSGNQLNINTGSSVGSGNGDSVRTAIIKTEDNFNDLYPFFPLQILPHTSSISQPSQIVGENNTNTLLGVTGSIQFKTGIGGSTAPPKSILANKIMLNNADASVPVHISIAKIPQQTQIVLEESSFRDQIVFSAADSQFGTNQNGRGLVIRTFVGAKSVIFWGEAQDAAFKFNGENNTNLIYGDGILLKVGINDQPTSNNTKYKRLTINGSAKGNEYFGSTDPGEDFPTTDPGSEGAWFSVGSDEILGGTSKFRILCVSQGPNPLIRDGLKYMTAFKNRGGNGLRYESPQIFGPPIAYDNAIRPEANLPNFRDLNSPQLQNTGQLYYNVYTTANSYNQTSRNTFVHPEGSGSFIFWWKGTGGTNNSNNRNRYMGSNSNFEIRRNNTQNQLVLSFGNNVQGYHNGNICDIENWHMIAFTFESSSGAIPFSTYIRGGGQSQINKYYFQGTTTTGFNINQGNFSIGTRNNNSSGGIFSSSLFLYYSRSLDESELDSIYSYFSGSHGL